MLIELIEKEVKPLQKKAANHDLFKAIKSIDAVRTFMQTHAFAVWDFMSLLTSVRQSVCCVTVPWYPKSTATLRRLINEIFVDEDSDKMPNKSGYASHYELYIESMKQIDADITQVENFVESVAQGEEVLTLLSCQTLPKGVEEFVKSTFDVIYRGKAHEIVAVFALGREQLIPKMFHTMVENLEENDERLSQLKYYLDRHIELDGDDHGPLATKLLAQLCQDNPTLIKEAIAAAVTEVESRIQLWDSILAQLSNKDEANILVETELALT